MPLSRPGWPRVSWTSSVGPLQFACFVAWLVLLVRPGDVPDPFALGLPLSWTAVCLAAAASVWLPHLLAGRWTSTPVDRLLALYLVSVALTSISTVDERVTMTAVLQLVANVGVFYATIVIARKDSRVPEAILLLLVSSIALLLLMALAYHAEIGLLNRLPVYAVPEGWSGYPELGMLAVVQCGLLIAGFVSAGSLLMFAVITSLVLTNLVELGFLYSRSSLLAVGLIFAVACLTVRRSQLLRLLGTVAVVTVPAALLFLANPTVRDLTVRAIAPDAVLAWSGSAAPPPVSLAADSRTDIWKRTLRMIADHPVRGVGLGNFEEVFGSRYNFKVSDDFRRPVHAHNLWLQQFAELGLIGGALYLALWIMMLKVSWQGTRAHPGFLSFGLLLSIAGILGSNLTTNMFFLTGGASGRLQSLTWILFGLAAAAAPAPIGVATPASRIRT